MYSFECSTISCDYHYRKILKSVIKVNVSRDINYCPNSQLDWNGGAQKASPQGAPSLSRVFQ